MSEPFSNLGDVVADECFPAVDLALRRGRHIHKGDERWYAFVSDAQALLEQLYARYGYELLHRSDGYYFLLPGNDSLGRRQLSVAEMIVGQGLALAYLDPRTLEKGAVITREELINQLAATMGTDPLLRALNPKRKRQDESVAQRTARQKVAEALRRLAQLGFVELLEDDQLRLAPSLMRFAEPVRGLDAPSEALRKLLERGEVSLAGDDAPADGEAELDAEGEGELAGEGAGELDAEALAAEEGSALAEAALAQAEAEQLDAEGMPGAVPFAEETFAEETFTGETVAEETFSAETFAESADTGGAAAPRRDLAIDSLAEDLWIEELPAPEGERE